MMMQQSRITSLLSVAAVAVCGDTAAQASTLAEAIHMLYRRATLALAGR